MIEDARPPSTPTLWLWRAVIVLGWVLILSGLGLFGWDCLRWLRDGAWPRDTLAGLWGRSPLGGAVVVQGWDDMRGLHYLLYRVLHWLGRFPVSLALVALGLLTAWIGNGRHERAEHALARRGRRHRRVP